MHLLLLQISTFSGICSSNGGTESVLDLLSCQNYIVVPESRPEMLVLSETVLK